MGHDAASGAKVHCSKGDKVFFYFEKPSKIFIAIFHLQVLRLTHPNKLLIPLEIPYQKTHLPRMIHTWGSQGGRTEVEEGQLGRPPRGQILNSRPWLPREIPSICVESKCKHSSIIYCLCKATWSLSQPWSWTPWLLSLFLAHLWDGVSILIPVGGKRLQEVTHISALQGPCTAQERLKEVRTKLYLGKRQQFI